MNPQNKTFEESMARLEQIVRAMERGDVALEESLKLFQEGTELVRSCQKLLDDAQLQVKKIMTAPDGSPVEATASAATSTSTAFSREPARERWQASSTRPRASWST